MPGQPNRRPRSEVPPTDPNGRAKPVGGGVSGSHEIDAAWGDTDDPRILKDRLRRVTAQRDKVKRDRADLKVAMRLKTEEAYNDGLLAVAPKLLEIDTKVAELADKILSRSTEGIDGDDLKALKVLLQETTKQRDRLYGKTRQRVQSSHVSAAVDLNVLMRQQREAQALPSGESGDVLDVDVEDAEMIDE